MLDVRKQWSVVSGQWSVVRNATVHFTRLQ
jgi:hypothetical protein